MATQNSSGQDYQNNADGFTLGGGTTERKLTLSGGDVDISGGSGYTYTFPGQSDTLVGRASSDSLINKDLTSGTNTFPTFNQNTTGNAATATNANYATQLQTTRTIGGVNFNGTANINLPGVNTTGSQNTTGSAATLTTPRTIQVNLGSTSAVSFNGSANVTPGVTGSLPVSSLGTGSVTGSNNGTPTSLTLWKGTQAQYNAIGSKDSNTVYVVT